MITADDLITVDALIRHCRADEENEQDRKDIEGFRLSAISYAEKYQNISYTGDNAEPMSELTVQAIRLMVSFWFDNRDISYNLNITRTENKTMQAVNNLLYFERRLNV